MTDSAFHILDKLRNCRGICEEMLVDRPIAKIKMITVTIALETLDVQKELLKQLKTELDLCLPYDFVSDVEDVIQSSLTTLSDAAFHLYSGHVDCPTMHARLACNVPLHDEILCMLRKKLYGDDNESESLPDTVIVDSDTSEEE